MNTIRRREFVIGLGSAAAMQIAVTSVARAGTAQSDYGSSEQQALRLSTYDTSRIVACAEDFPRPHYIAVSMALVFSAA